jgi:hypothetical protein
MANHQKEELHLFQDWITRQTKNTDTQRFKWTRKTNNNSEHSTTNQHTQKSK